MDEDDVLTLPEIAELRGLNASTPRGWVTSGRLTAHKDPIDPRKWLVYKRDLDAFLDSPSGRSDIGRPRGRGAVAPTTRVDWSDAPEQATLDLTSSVELPASRR
jgi:excisionase family DNA binding protein